MRGSQRGRSYLYSFLLRVAWALDSFRERFGLTLYTVLRRPICSSSHVAWAAETGRRNLVCLSCGHTWEWPKAQILTNP